MKIGILTLHSQVNYGGVLQAYALCRELEILGYQDAEVIDFWRSPSNLYLVGPWLNSEVPIGRRIWEFLKYSLRYEFPLGDIVRRKRTAGFIRKHIRLSQKAYPTAADLEGLCGYDCVIVGSDQVWNCHWFGNPNPFLLNTISAQCRKISYAASFGFKELPIEQRETYRKGLTSFDAISVRERDAVDLVRQWSGRKAEWCLDPVLLLPQQYWNEVARASFRKNPYIFCYWLGDIGSIIGALIKISEKVKRPILLYVDSPRELSRRSSFIARLEGRIKLLNVRHIRICSESGPCEFLSDIRDCECVLTNSFHAMMFSIIYRKPLRVYHKSDVGRSLASSRMISFAEYFGVSDVLEEGALSDSPVFRRPNYDAVWQGIDIERKNSIQYLKENIKD